MPEKRDGDARTPTRPDALGEQMQRLQGEIALRLRPVCPNMPVDEFDRMIEGMAAIELKYMHSYTWRSRRD
jgi:hypothetical protein